LRSNTEVANLVYYGEPILRKKPFGRSLSKGFSFGKGKPSCELGIDNPYYLERGYLPPSLNIQSTDTSLEKSNS